MWYAIDGALAAGDDRAAAGLAGLRTSQAVRRQLCSDLRARRCDDFQTLLDGYVAAVERHLTEASARRYELPSLLDAVSVVRDVFQVAGRAADVFMTRDGYQVDLTRCFALAGRLIMTVNRSCDGTFATTTAAVRNNLGNVLRLRHAVFDSIGSLARATFLNGQRHLVERIVDEHAPENVELVIVSLGNAGSVFVRSDDRLARYLDHALSDAALYFDFHEPTSANLYFFRAYLRLLSVSGRDAEFDERGETFWSADGLQGSADQAILDLLKSSPVHADRVLHTLADRLHGVVASDPVAAATTRSSIAAIHADHGRFDLARRTLADIDPGELSGPSRARSIAAQWLRLGDVDQARSILDSALAVALEQFDRVPHGVAALMELSLADDLDEVVRFYEDSRRVAASAVEAGRSWWMTGDGDPPSALPVPDLVIADVEQCLNTVGLGTFPAGLLAASGARVAAATAVDLGFPVMPTRHNLDGLATANDGDDMHPRSTHYEWRIDPRGHHIGALGINCYQAIFERVARMFRAFRVDLESPYGRRIVSTLVTRCDRTLRFVEAVRTDAETDGRRVALVAVQPQFAPWSVLRDYARLHPDTLEFVHVTSGYQNWLENRVTGQATTIAMANLTRHPTTRTATLGVAERFDEFMLDEFIPRRRFYEAAVTAALAEDRTRRTLATDASTAAPWQAAVEAAKAEGRTVFCALGKVPFDLAVPTMGGPAHADIADWITHTVGSFAGSEHLLLVKPHPHEVAMSIAQAPAERLADLVTTSEQPETVIWLGHHEASLQQLSAVVDVFLVWNGTAIVELGATGATVVACDEWAGRDYPVRPTQPPDRTTYAAWLRDPTSIPTDPDFVTRCRGVVAYLGSDWVAVEHPWLRRSSSNLDFNRPQYDPDQVGYRNAGEPRAVRRLLESFELRDVAQPGLASSMQK